MGRLDRIKRRYLRARRGWMYCGNGLWASRRAPRILWPLGEAFREAVEEEYAARDGRHTVALDARETDIVGRLVVAADAFDGGRGPAKEATDGEA